MKNAAALFLSPPLFLSISKRDMNHSGWIAEGSVPCRWRVVNWTCGGEPWNCCIYAGMVFCPGFPWLWLMVENQRVILNPSRVSSLRGAHMGCIAVKLSLLYAVLYANKKTTYPPFIPAHLLPSPLPPSETKPCHHAAKTHTKYL